MKLDDATISQNVAAEPGSSTWLSANAGSGKTRVLTDRVARLLLDGVPPQNILCLTYTKAAASEMQIRLFRRLGEWAMKPDGALAEDLQRMGETDIGDPQRLARARRLFARAIETPGGLRIQTIHSFCSSLLRRFPLESGVTPAFVEMDDRAAEQLRAEVVEDLADGKDVAAVDAVATYYSGDDLGSLTRAIVTQRGNLSDAPSREDLLRLFGQPEHLTMEEVLAAVFDGSESALMAALLSALRGSDKGTDHNTAAKLCAADWGAPGPPALSAAISALLTGGTAKEPYSAKLGKVPTKDCRAGLGSLADDLDAFMQRVENARPGFVALNAADKTQALYRFSTAFLPAYEARKQAHGWLDFDDLILKTRALLTDPAVANWVLYRLDGGLDHILVDEAQDTSPAQWDVVKLLAQEFSTGLGAQDGKARTIFVVGDKKQSIYSFQGADPEGFDRMCAHFQDRMQGAGLPFQKRELGFSFRSSEAILRLVDTVFGDVPDARMDLDTQHRAFNAELPGRVDLWPVVPKTDGAENRDWFDPVDLPGEDHNDVVLARQIAVQIVNSVGSETIPLADGTRRAVRAGDFLILVRRRSTLFAEIIRACKARGLPVAGADRLKLGGELAVKDLAAVLSFLATPEDDLSLAAALRSPLFGWSEGALYDLAAARKETYLWAALRHRTGDWPETMAILTDLLGQADFLRPYDLIERILSRHDGRRKLLARLGPEAEDGIDSLLAQALAYERMDVPSLTGFLTWLETDDVEVKRQMDNAGDRIRVMTVHGAKGLESPIVILPDTAERQKRFDDEVVPLENGTALWKTGANAQPEVMEEAIIRLKTARQAEDLRLLYVAMTRAETWLIVAASGDVKKPGGSWYDLVRQGMTGLDVTPHETPLGQGMRLGHLDWSAGTMRAAEKPAAHHISVPDWADIPVPMPEKTRTLSPSDLGGAKVIGDEADGDMLDSALRRGRQIHLLLEHLPGLPEAEWSRVAAPLLAEGEDVLEEGELGSLLSEAAGVLDAPDLGWLFASDVLSEVDISATLADLDGGRIHGTIDKLVVGPDKVIAVDFKTNRVVPDRPEDVPDGLLRQMAAYDAALRQIYPDRAVETAILWTSTPSLMPLPHDIVRASLRSWSIS